MERQKYNKTVEIEEQHLIKMFDSWNSTSATTGNLFVYEIDNKSTEVDCKFTLESESPFGDTFRDNYFVEAKVRDMKYGQFPTMILECKTKDRVMSEDGTALYVNFFTDGSVLTYNLSKIDFDKLQVEKRWLPSTSCEDRTNKKKIKDCYMLPLKMGKHTYL